MVCLVCHKLCAAGEVGVKDRLGNCYHMYCMLVFYVLCLGSLAWDGALVEQSRLAKAPSDVTTSGVSVGASGATALEAFQEMFPDESGNKKD